MTSVIDYILLILSLIQTFVIQADAGPIDIAVSDQDATTSNPLFNIVVTDHTGADASHRLAVRHYSPATPSSTKTPSINQPSISPRDTIFRIVNQCPGEMQVVFSRCLPVVSSRVWFVLCRNNNDAQTSNEFGECLENEICIEDNSNGMVNSRAWCVSFVDMAMAYVDSRQGKKTVTVGSGQAKMPLGSAGGFSVEAVITSMDSSQTMLASVLEVEAQKSIEVHGQLLWQTFPGSSIQCASCSRLQLANVPAGTQRFNVNVQLQDPTGTGVMHLVAFEPSIIG